MMPEPDKEPCQNRRYCTAGIFNPVCHKAIGRWRGSHQIEFEDLLSRVFEKIDRTYCQKCRASADAICERCCFDGGGKERACATAAVTARHVLIDMFKEARRRGVQLEIDPEQEAENQGPPKVLADEEQRHELLLAVGKLSEPHKLVLRERFAYDREWEVIGRTLRAAFPSPRHKEDAKPKALEKFAQREMDDAVSILRRHLGDTEEDTE